jgi:hypothetical protein
MTISKYIIVLALSAIPLASSSDKQTKTVDKAYVLGFEDGTDAVTNAFKNNLAALEKESKNGKNSSRDKKSSDKRTPDPP